MKIALYFVGKPKDKHANAIAVDFVERISHYVKAEMREIRPDRTSPWEVHPSGWKIAMDPAGKKLDSREFTSLVSRAENEARDLVFLVGGADGLTPEWRTRSDQLISLSPMTFPHELARAMLAEQIYRAFTTLRGHPYPR